MSFATPSQDRWWNCSLRCSAASGFTSVFLGTEHGGAITSTIQQLLTGTLSTLTEIPTVRTEVAAGATRTGADSTTTAATRAAAAAVAAALARKPDGAL